MSTPSIIYLYYCFQADCPRMLLHNAEKGIGVLIQTSMITSALLGAGKSCHAGAGIKPLYHYNCYVVRHYIVQGYCTIIGVHPHTNLTLTWHAPEVL